MKKVIIIFTGFIFLVFSALIAGSLSFDYSFENPGYENGEIKSHFDAKTMKPGDPIVPYFTAKILLPFGEKVEEIEVYHSTWMSTAEGVKINFAKNQKPISSSEKIETIRNEKIYTSDKPYPANDFKYLDTFTFAGHNIAFIKLFPIKFLPKSGVVKFSPNWTLKVNTKYNAELANHQSRMLCNSPEITNQLEEIVENRSELISYYGKESVNEIA